MKYVKDLNKDIFQSKFLYLLPETCEYCGSPIEVVESFNSLQCSNPDCFSKIAYRMYALLEDLGDKTFTVDECIKIINNFEITNPYSIFIYNPEEDGEIYEGYGMEKSLEFYKNLSKRRGMLLWEYVKIGNVEHLKSSAEKIFKYYTNLFEFYKQLSKEGIPFIQSLLLKNTDFDKSEGICVDAVLIYEALLQHKDEFLEGLEGVVIIEPEIKFSVLFANNVENYPSNRDFLYMLNSKLKNKIYFYPVYSVSSDIDFLYWDDKGLKTINSMVKEVQEKYPKTVIVNAENIFNKVLEVLSHA